MHLSIVVKRTLMPEAAQREFQQHLSLHLMPKEPKKEEWDIWSSDNPYAEGASTLKNDLVSKLFFAKKPVK